ncbi:MAG: sulfotransferase domain-containing protein [Betaproteobacteria bacterium]
MRLVLASTPRSGNTLLRGLLAGVYGLQQFAVHDVADLDWRNLPMRSIVQIHWHRTASFLQLLEDNSFRPITIARHPFDVLLSILHFSSREPATRRWLLGEGGDEASIHGANPMQQEFARYATGGRAGKLLSITPQWWRDGAVIKLRYEDLVRDTARTLQVLESEFGPPLADTTQVIAQHALDELRTSSSNMHFWQGTPGLWKSLLTNDVAHAIAAAHPDVFATLDYPTEQDRWPGEHDVNSAWVRVAIPLPA